MKSHKNKLLALKTTMENWMNNHNKGISNRNGRLHIVSISNREDRLFEADLHKLNELIDESNVHGEEPFLTKKQMIQLNNIFKTYRVSPPSQYWDDWISQLDNGQSK